MRCREGLKRRKKKVHQGPTHVCSLFCYLANVLSNVFSPGGRQRQPHPGNTHWQVESAFQPWAVRWEGGRGFTVQAVFLKKLSKSPELSLRPYLKPVFADGLRMESLGVTFNQYHRVLIKGRNLDTERDVPWEKLSKSGAKESQRLPASHRRLTCDVPPTINTFFVRGPTVMVREMCKRFSVTILRGNCPRDTLSSDVYLSEWRTINVHCLSHLVCSALLQNLSKWQRAWMGHLHPLSRSNTILFLWWDPIFTCISLPISVSSSRYFLDYIIFGHHHLYA